MLIATGTTADTETKRPNVLLIYCDDVGYADISAYAHAAKDTHTPQINRIAERGVLFTQGYATSPICNVSRSSIVTGQYPQSNGTRWYGGPGLTQVPIGTTLAEQLKAGGYRTVSIGKHHFGSVGEPNNTDAELRTARDNPVNHGFDEFFGFIHSEKDYARNTQDELDQFIKHATANGVTRNEAIKRARQAVIGPMIRAQHNAGAPTLKREDRPGYTTDIFTDEAIKQFDKQNAPLFVAVNYNALHTQLWNAVPQPYKEKRGITEEETSTYSPGAYDGQLPFWTFNHRYAWFAPGNTKDKLGDINDPRDTAGNRFRRKLYLAALDHLDDNVGRLLDALQASGQLDNTIVIFTGDNGGSHNIGADNSPLTGHKYMLGEGGIRVPFIVSWLGREDDGRVIKDAVSQMDLIDTILSASKLENGTRTDGRDLSEIISGIIEQDYRTQFWDSGNDWVVRHANWKLRVITNNRDFPNFKESPGTFLYRLDQDPSEQKNLADDHPAIVTALTAEHQAWVEKQYKVAPIFRDNSLIRNGSFEHTEGNNQRAIAWQYQGDVESIGATVGGAMPAADGIWRGYLQETGRLWQITERKITAGDTYRLKFSVNTTGSTDHGVAAQLIASDDEEPGYQKLSPTIRAIANDSDAIAWQSYEITFKAEQGAEYLGKKIGVVIQGIGSKGYRAIDAISLNVE
ncbi:MAG: sulfatase [Phycisphaeraceae bacterium]